MANKTKNAGQSKHRALIAAVNDYAVAHNLQLYILGSDSPKQRNGKVGRAYRSANQYPHRSFTARVIACYKRRNS